MSPDDAPSLSSFQKPDWSKVISQDIPVVSLKDMPDVWEDTKTAEPENLMIVGDFTLETKTVDNRQIIALTGSNEKTRALMCDLKGEDAIAISETDKDLNIAIADGNSTTVAGRAAAIEVAKFAIDSLNSASSVPDINLIKSA